MLKVELKNCLKFSTYSENVTPKKIPKIVAEVPIMTPIKKKILTIDFREKRYINNVFFG